MPETPRSTNHALCAALCLCCVAADAAAAAPAADATPPATAEPDALAARSLRGYGLASAVRHADGTVVVTAESPEKALLWAARYLHVMERRRVAPGVVQLPDGSFVAVRVDDRRVAFAHSATRPADAYDGPLPDIPMYLDSFDDNAFRFYYRQNEAPGDPADRARNWAAYDPRGEFDFAKENGDLGFVFWVQSQFCEAARGMSTEREWNWAYHEASTRDLPVVLNTALAMDFALLDTHREDVCGRNPGFEGSYQTVGDWYKAGSPFASWASGPARDEALRNTQRRLVRYNAGNVIEIMEPHGELNHGDHTVFLEHGAMADASFRRFLRERHGPDWRTVARRWRDTALRGWGDILLPQVVEFAGYGPDAIDLEGEWRLRYLDEPESEGFRHVAPHMPGHDATLFLPKRPARLRREFPFRPEDGRRTWLCVWDLAEGNGATFRAWLNGSQVAEETLRHRKFHWMAVDATDLLHDGGNVLEVETPAGKLCHKVYLTHEEPRAYPYFEPGMNARWADFCAWQEWTRIQAVEKGLSALRAVEPDKSIVLMAPDAYFAPMRGLARRYGARFHNTGYMGVFWGEQLPMLMRSRDMPMSVEPGGPARDVRQFKAMTNYWIAECVNAIHYFIHIGSIYWNDEIRAEFLRRLPVLKAMGRWQSRDNEIAMVLDSSINALMGFPWRQGDPNAAYPSGYYGWRFNEALKGDWQLDAVTPADFADGNASRYRFLLDCNNTLVTPETAAGIERYIRGGGTYFAMFETGRHSPDEPDRWMLAELAGVRLRSLSRYAMRRDSSGVPRPVCDERRRVETVPGNGGVDTLPRAVRTDGADGAAFDIVAPDAEALLRWEDGSAAVVSRRVGRGRIVVFGLRPNAERGNAEMEIIAGMLRAWGAEPIPITAGPRPYHCRQYVTTDGLDDVWIVTGFDAPGANPYEITFRDGRARVLVDLFTGKPLPLSGTVEEGAIIVASSPRGEDAMAAWRWVRNQFGWWQGGRSPDWMPPPVVPGQSDPADPRDTLDLSRHLPLSWDVARPDYSVEIPIEIPQEWSDGEITLWGVGQYAGRFCRGSFRAFLDGRELPLSPGGGLTGLPLSLAAGAHATLRLDVAGDNHPLVHGFDGPCFLHYRPRPVRSLDLSGPWEVWSEAADPTPRAASLPGPYRSALMLRRVFDLPRGFAEGGRARIIFTDRGGALTGVIVNGRYVRRHHHRFGDRTDLDVTPYLREGGENEIFLVGDASAHSGELESIVLDCVPAPGN